MARQLARRLVLEGQARTADGAGGFETAWVPLGTLWAEVRPGPGRDAAGTEVTRSDVAFRITVRGAAPGAPSRPQPEQRFRDGGRTFRILAVTEADASGSHLVCFAREEVPT